MKSAKLLTIAIPTWNRGAILRRGLGRLLPQVENFGDRIEILVSDNASTDDTQEVVLYFKERFGDLDFNYIRQEKNSGHAGNYRACRNLAKGTFLWLLSDDDHLEDGVLAKVMEVLGTDRNVAAVYLDSWEKVNKATADSGFVTEKISFLKLFESAKNYATLISSGIMRNEKRDDSRLYSRFGNSSFFCFILFVHAKRYFDDVWVVSGKSLQTRQSKNVSYDWFNAFVEEISTAMKYMEEIGFEKSATSALKKGLIVNAVRGMYCNYKMEEKDAKKTRAIEKRLFRNYADSIWFWYEIGPFILCPTPLMRPFMASIRRAKKFIVRTNAKQGMCQ